MKTILSLLLLATMLAGCSTSKSSMDWSSRVGKMTYADAVAELGQPAATLDQTDGVRSAEWLVHRGSSSFQASRANSWASGLRLVVT